MAKDVHPKNRNINRQDFVQFVEAKVQPALRALAIEFWELVESEAPALSPGMRGGTEKYIAVPVWRLRRDAMVLSPSRDALTISFANGASFDDPEGLLGGAGKTSRTLKVRTRSDLTGPSIRSFLRQAMQHS